MDLNDPIEKQQYMAGYDTALAMVLAQVLRGLGDPIRSDVLLKLQMQKPFENETMWRGFRDATAAVGQ